MADTAQDELLPAYLRIAEILTRDIGSGQLADGARLPPERDLAPQLGVSVGTLRKALSELEARGLLTRRHGSGNYVRFDGRAAGGYSMFRLELRSGGGLPTAQPISVELMRKPIEYAALGTAPQAFRIRRLRLLSDIPVALEEIWLDGRFGDRLEPEDVRQSLYRHYRDAFGLWILRAEDRLSADLVPDWAPESFPLLPKTQAVRVDRMAWDQHGLVAEMSITYFDPSRAAYLARLP